MLKQDLKKLKTRIIRALYKGSLVSEKKRKKEKKKKKKKKKQEKKSTKLKISKTKTLKISRC